MWQGPSGTQDRSGENGRNYTNASRSVDPGARIRGTNKHHISNTYQAPDSDYLDRRRVQALVRCSRIEAGYVVLKGKYLVLWRKAKPRFWEST
jgi:hypothetical protein